MKFAFNRFHFTLILLIVLSFTAASHAQFGDPVPRYPNEMDGFIRVTDFNPSCRFSETDLSVPGRGLGINFTRTYNSRAPLWSADLAAFLGRNQYWSHNYQWRLQYKSRHGTRNGKFYTFQNGSGQTYTFEAKTRTLIYLSWSFFEPADGTQARLFYTVVNGEIQFIMTTKHGVKYKFEPYYSPHWPSSYVLTQITDQNGNRITLHYEDTPVYHRYQPESIQSYYTDKPRLVAVKDSVGRILKFYYELRGSDFPPLSSSNPFNYERWITKIEFGVGTPQALTTVYQTVRYTYTNVGVNRSSGQRLRYRLKKVHRDLGTGDPRGTEIVTQYEYDSTIAHTISSLTLISPTGLQTEVDHQGADQSTTTKAGTPLALIRNSRRYDQSRYQYGWSGRFTDAYDTDNLPDSDLNSTRDNRRNSVTYAINNGRVAYLRTHRMADAPRTRLTREGEITAYFYWYYDRHGNITATKHYDYTLPSNTNRRKWYYKIYYEGTNADHNAHYGNPTKWEQVTTTSPYQTVLRKWEADYETKYNKPIWQIDPMGHKTEFTYDDRGNLIRTVSKANTGTQSHAVAHDIITTHEYDDYGNRIKTTFMPGTTQQKIVQTVYDSTYHTYPIEVKTTVTVNGAAHTIRTRSEWDINRGLKTADINAMGKRTEYAYWKDGLLKYTRRVTDNLYTVPTYDKAGNVTQTQVRQNNWQTGTIIAQTKMEYDGLSRPIKSHAFSNNNWTTPYATSTSTYDLWGNLTQTKDPRDLITNYTYDKHGRLTKQTLPDGDWVETRYNGLDQVTKAWTSQTGSETAPAISHTYDTLNRPLTTTYSTRETVSFTYDKADNPLTMTTNDGATTYTYTNTYDQLNRLITRTDSLLNKKTLYEYNDSGTRKRLHIQPSTGGRDLYDVTYTYDEANRLLSVRDVLSNKTASYEYFDNGVLKKTTLPNGITTHRTLDTLNRLDTLQYKKTTTAVLASLDYNYDVKSNVTQLIRNDTGAGGSRKTFRFAYDGISRLTSANYGNETVTYTYDKVGNRKTMVSTTKGTTTYTIASNSNQLTYRSLVPEDTAFATMSYTYDAEGKLTQRSEGTDSDAFTYGWGGMLKQIQKTRASTVTQTLSYAYDGAGQRVKVTDSSGTRYFLYDSGMPLLELNSTKTITASYLYGADGVVYRKKHTSTPSYEYHLKNALGSTIIETNNSKTVLARYEYDVFGAVRSQTGTSDNVRKFTGKEYDADVKLYYYAARYYDPYTARFNSRDPAKDGINWYAYVANNPLKFIDPTGLRAVNQTEREALIFTFGEDIGNYLAGAIDIEIRDLDVLGKVPGRSTSKIYLKTGYSENNLQNLSTFIHEATHIWQRRSGRHRNKSDYKYTWEQLDTLELGNEEHASAVQDWFFVSYGITNGLIIPRDAWNQLAKRNLDVESTIDSWGNQANNILSTPPWNTPEMALNVVEYNYARVISEIRNSNHLPQVRIRRQVVADQRRR